MDETINIVETGEFLLPPAKVDFDAWNKYVFHPDHTTEQAPKNKSPYIRVNSGTTTLGFIYKDGICICVDSRATQGPYVASQSVQKFIPITKYLVGTMAGGAADCQYWERDLGRRARLYQLRHGKRVTTSAASKMLANIMYQYKGYGLSMGTMVAGVDDAAGPSLYYVDNGNIQLFLLFLDATRLKGDKFAVGSGATFAWGVLDQGFKTDLEMEEAVALGQKAILTATHRDAFSGGYINVVLITKEGWKHLSHKDSHEIFWKEYGPRLIPAARKS